MTKQKSPVNKHWKPILVPGAVSVDKLLRDIKTLGGEAEYYLVSKDGSVWMWKEE